MGHHIPPETVQQVQGLLVGTTLSYRQIAKITRISRSVVTLIATGKRKPYPNPTGLTGPVRRCPTCGSMTHTPCYACHIRKLKTKPVYQTPLQPLKLGLQGDDHTRYQQTRHITPDDDEPTNQNPDN